MFLKKVNFWPSKNANGTDVHVCLKATICGRFAVVGSTVTAFALATDFLSIK